MDLKPSIKVIKACLLSQMQIKLLIVVCCTFPQLNAVALSSSDLFNPLYSRQSSDTAWRDFRLQLTCRFSSPPRPARDCTYAEEKPRKEFFRARNSVLQIPVSNHKREKLLFQEALAHKSLQSVY